MSDPLTKGLTREGVEKSSTGMGLWPRTSHRGGNSTQKTGDPKIQVQGDKTKSLMTVQHGQKKYYYFMVHSHDETMFSNQDKDIRTF